MVRPADVPEMTAADDLRVVVRTSAGTARVSARGELDRSNAPELDAAIRVAEESAAAVELDLRGLTFMDASGIRLLLAWTSHAHSANLALSILPPPADVARVCELVGVTHLLPLVEAA
jgi:anti-sigma B factor antagonist